MEPFDVTVAVTVVVAVRAEDPGPDACLRAIEDQRFPGVEVVVVSDSVTDSAASPVRGAARTVELPGALVPQLWAAGIAAARGRIVALTAGSLVPDPGWIAGLADALAVPGRVGVGGAIEPGAALSVSDWARYFCRYAPYLRPFARGVAVELPADCAAYDRAALLRHHDRWVDGFWEPFVHRALREDGELVMDERVAVRLMGGHSAARFARARFRHGREHGRRRAQNVAVPRVLAAALTFPAVPPLMTYRAGRAVWRCRKHRIRFLVAAPIVLWFYSWWAVGECGGRLEVMVGR